MGPQGAGEDIDGNSNAVSKHGKIDPLSSQTKVTPFSDKKVVIKSAGLSEEIQQNPVNCAMQTLERFNIERDIAAHIKNEMDKKHNPTWHLHDDDEAPDNSKKGAPEN